MKYSAVLKCYDLTVLKGIFTAYVRLVPQSPNKYGCRTGQHPLLVFDILIEKDNICGLLAFQLLKNLWLLWNAKKNLGNNALNKRWQHAVSKSFSCEKFDHLVLDQKIFGVGGGRETPEKLTTRELPLTQYGNIMYWGNP